MPTLNVMDNTGNSRATVLIFDTGGHGDGIRVTEETTPTLQARMGTGGNNTPMVAYEPTLAFSSGQSAQAYGLAIDENVTPPLRACGGNNSMPTIQKGPTVRRLTPTECERLQGFPDGWTTHRIDEKKGLVEQADSARYKQMGNAVAVPVVEWIMARLVEVDNG